MSLLDRMPFKAKLAALLILPLAGFAFYSVDSTLRHAQEARAMARLDRLAVLATRISPLVHELQKERGATALFLGSQGATFGDEVKARRQDTEARRAELETFLGDFQADAYGPEFQGLLAKGRKELESLNQRREAASLLKTSVQEHLTYYTGLIGAWLAVAGQIPNLSQDVALANMGHAYVNLMQGKEKAGVERATLSNVLAAGRFGEGLFARFAALGAAQEVYFAQFRATATPAQAAFFKDKVSGPSVDEVTRIRALAFEKVATGNFGVDPAHWFKVSTDRINALKEVDDRLAADLSALSQRLQAEAQSALRGALMATLFVWSLTLVAVVAVIRSTSRSLGNLAASMEDIAMGEADLTRHIRQDSHDELGRVASAYNHFAENLATFVGQIQASAGTIAETAAGISSGNRGLASRTEQQAAGLEETAASLEELTSTVKQTATAAATSSDQAQQACELTQAGGDMVHQVMATMEEVRKASTRIAEITSLVDEIAFQTNLLALNAAVEAARAGEHGRGFAVVAGEVRILAKRSSDASREIRTLVQAGVDRAQVGTELASQAEERMHEVLASVGRVSSLLSEIATATQEQSIGLDQVNQAVAHMDTATQQNATLVSAADESSAALDEEAKHLLQEVSRYRIK
ncbi:methyl-accepting chemotaxis protein [Geothrix sp. PMB-07]|uniref:methyl-accepting chemotaxis protein n=1 Tax=Geothrix sp. PMB-07 TaxID=3068640 RepID=UPI002740F43E|nr:methyl-accepting chemotaxis protein [Geothrix sp. PMB-07]WLT33199.1 nitrate- and nitrite sensing domain-containing protein [Geothrix sp. PMB-07]